MNTADVAFTLGQSYAEETTVEVTSTRGQTVIGQVTAANDYSVTIGNTVIAWDGIADVKPHQQ